MSVVIPAFRASATIGRAVASVLAQSLPAWEIIIVDDGSPDDLKGALAGYGDRVTLLRQENGGAASARNRGVDAATGAFIAFLDADDYWEPHKLERQLQILEAHPELGMVASRYHLEAPGSPRREPPPPPPEFLDQVVQGSGAVAFEFMTHLWTSTILVRRSVLGAHRFDTSLRTAEDRDLWIRLLLSAPAYLESEPLATAVAVPDSLTRSGPDLDFPNMLHLIRKHADLLEPSGVRKREALTYQIWAAGHLVGPRPGDALKPALRRLRLEPASAQAWWIVLKSGAMRLTSSSRRKRPRLDVATSSTIAGRRPPRFVLDGCYGGVNVGDEALLAATASLVRSAYPDAEIRVFSGDPDSTVKQHGLNAVRQNNPLGLGVYGAIVKGQFAATLSALRRSDVFILGGGELLRDDLHAKAVLGAFYRLLLARAMGLRVYLIGVGAQPTTRRLGRVLFKRVYRAATGILFRDPESLLVAQECGADPRKLDWCPDVVFSSKPSGNPRPVPEKDVEPLRVGVALKGGSRHAKASQRDRSEIARTVGAFFERLANERALELTIFAFAGADLPIAEIVAARAEAASIPVHSETSGDLTSISKALAGLDLLIAMPLHASILGFVEGTPTLGLSYDLKVEKLYRQFGLEAHCIPLDEVSAENLHSRFLALEADSPNVRHLLGLRVEEARTRVEAAFRKLMSATDA